MAIGSLQSLQCNLLGTDKQNLAIHNWKFESKIIASSSPDYKVFYESAKSVLILQNSSMDPRGNYKCIIGNEKHKNFCQFKIRKLLFFIYFSSFSFVFSCSNGSWFNIFFLAHFFFKHKYTHTNCTAGGNKKKKQKT